MKSTAFSAFLMVAVSTYFPIFTRAEEPTGPTGGVTNGNVESLIGKLGDDDFHIRLDASDKLRAMGPSVIPALKEARLSQDPEIHAQADDILEDLEHPLSAMQIPQPSGFGSQMMRVSIVNGVRVIDAQEPGRSTHIEQGANGISMKITGQLNGRTVTREFKARDAEQLKRANPQAAALYLQMSGNGSRQFGMHANVLRVGANMNINGGMIFPGQVVLQPAPRVRANQNNIDLIEKNLIGQMKAGNIPQEQQEKIKGLLKQLRDNAGVVDNADVDPAKK